MKITKETTITLLDSDTEDRVDKILVKKFPTYSRTYFQHLIEEGCILLNGRPMKKREKTKEGDLLHITFKEMEGPNLEPEAIPLSILYEDEHIIAIDKPIGMVVHPGAGRHNQTFVNALLHHVQDLPKNGETIRPGIVHRLDKDTSGVLVAAKTLLAHNRLVDLFKDRKMHKQYVAICKGIPKEGIISAPIKRDPYHRTKMTIHEEGKSAETEIIIIERTPTHAIVVAKPKTGRTHQIRVHLKHLGTPIVGDPIYSTKASGTRLFLHAHVLEFYHPISGAHINLMAPLPQEFYDWAKNQNIPLEKYIAFRYPEVTV